MLPTIRPNRSGGPVAKGVYQPGPSAVDGVLRAERRHLLAVPPPTTAPASVMSWQKGRREVEKDVPQKQCKIRQPGRNHAKNPIGQMVAGADCRDAGIALRRHVIHRLVVRISACRQQYPGRHCRKTGPGSDDACRIRFWNLSFHYRTHCHHQAKGTRATGLCRYHRRSAADTISHWRSIVSTLRTGLGFRLSCRSDTARRAPPPPP